MDSLPREGSSRTEYVTYETEKPQPRAVLVGVPLEDEMETLAELAQLAKTLGFVVVDQLVQRRRSLSGPFVLGEGKLEELKARCQDGVEAVIFDCELTPSQVSNLQNACAVDVLDRTGVIVEIFSRHARTREARLQVEIARLKYLAPRLRKAGRGPTARADKGGETGLELDRRRIRDRIAELKKELESIADEAATGRSRRAEQRCVAPICCHRGRTGQKEFNAMPTKRRRFRLRAAPSSGAESSPSRGWKLLPSASFGWLVDREM